MRLESDLGFDGRYAISRITPRGTLLPKSISAKMRFVTLSEWS